MKREFIIRIRIISILLICFVLILITRLYLLQIVRGNEFEAKADRQYTSTSGAVFDRGGIYFSDKDGKIISGATLKNGFKLTINPQKTSDPDGSCAKIKEILADFDCQNFAERAKKKNDVYEELEKKVSEDDAKKITELKLPGVTLYKTRWRYYPGGSLAAHLLGLMGYKGNDLAGRYGLESEYESTLKRETSKSDINFFADIFADINKTLVKKEDMEGDLVTTIDPITQGYLEEQLKKVRNKWNSDLVGGIIINPKNGEIYAMAVTPAFDPNNFSESDPDLFSNDLVEHIHEMGSVIKPLTMAAAIDTGAVSANTTYNDSGSVKVGIETIYNFDKKGRGLITLQEALGRSLNTGFVFVERKIGNQKFGEYLKKFGLGEKTGIDLPNEATGQIKNVLESNRDIEYATASFGQGIAMTPVEAVRAISALANGGTLVTPHIVKKINYKIGYSKDISFPEAPRVISKTTSEEITRMLVVDYDTYFQNGASKNPNYTIAEKTGTAQIPLPNSRGYYDDRSLHSFFGYLPAFDPKVLVFLYTVYPKGVLYSSESLGPTFVDMTKFLINYYNIPPDR